MRNLCAHLNSESRSAIVIRDIAADRAAALQRHIHSRGRLDLLRPPRGAATAELSPGPPFHLRRQSKARRVAIYIRVGRDHVVGPRRNMSKDVAPVKLCCDTGRDHFHVCGVAWRVRRVALQRGHRLQRHLRHPSRRFQVVKINVAAHACARQFLRALRRRAILCRLGRWPRPLQSREQEQVRRFRDAA